MARNNQSTVKKEQSMSPQTMSYLGAASELSGHTGARGNTYGSAKENFQRIADLLTAQLGLIKDLPQSGCLTRRLTCEDVALMMIQVKASRLANVPTHADSWIDIAGYVNCASHIHNGE